MSPEIEELKGSPVKTHGKDHGRYIVPSPTERWVAGNLVRNLNWNRCQFPTKFLM